MILHQLSDRSLLVIGAVLCAIAAWCTVGYHHPDEHFQIWEFAHHKMGRIPESALPWEFPEEMRPGLQPFLAYSCIRFFEGIGIYSPFFQVFFMRLLSSLAALWVYWRWTEYLAPGLKNPSTLRWMRIGLLFFWLMPYLNARFSSENTSAICFFGGLLILVKSLDNTGWKAPANLFWAGLLLGLSFFFRYQIAFAAIGLGGWLVFAKRPTLLQWSWLMLGAVAAFGIGLATDVWLYDEWVFAPYNYFFSNIMEGKAATFGVEPFWWYFTELPIAFFPPLSIFLLVMAGIGFYRNPTHMFSWCLVPFVLAHSLVAHKEVRFLFPMALPFFFFAAAGWQHFSATRTFKPGWKKAFQFFLVINVLLLLFRIFIPAKEMTAYAGFLWHWGEKHPESAVYFVKQMPRNNFPLNMPFYENPKQKQLSWYTDPLYKNDTTALKPGDLFFFTEVLNPKPQAPPGYQLKKVYNYYPELLLLNNSNNWQSRTRIWEVYEILPAAR